MVHTRRTMYCAALCCGALTLSLSDDARAVAPDTSRGDALLAEYFRLQARDIAANCLREIKSADDWQARRPEYHRQLRDMLGLDPWPERTPLNPQITGRLEHADFVVEKLHFQSAPGLYVTANLYLPRHATQPAPAVLYVCGHAVMKDGDVMLGNKTGYQHHGAWFARNGYVCLTIDTIGLGEITGLHHGTCRYGMWWWHNRGYTPAGVEAWNGMRAIDYLQSRPEVDGARIGVTGRSGGGAYSWWIAALDDRVKAAVPVAGMADMHSQIVTGCIDYNCDCMFMVNTYAWDFSLVGALIAPRALLVSNTDNDRLFPVEAVVDMFASSRRVFRLLGPKTPIGLNITEGGHKDTQELRMSAFVWMNQHLKQEDPVITIPAQKMFEPKELKVFDTIPADERVTTVQEWFVPAETGDYLPQTKDEYDRNQARWNAFLKQQCFRNWPAERARPAVGLVSTTAAGSRRLREYEFLSQEPYRLSFFAIDDAAAKDMPRNISVEVLDQAGWEGSLTRLKERFPAARLPEFSADSTAGNSHQDDGLGQGMQILFAPRGVGPSEWSRDERKRTHIKRRFALIGTTDDSMRIYDAKQLLAAVRETFGNDAAIELRGAGEAAGWALHAALDGPPVANLALRGLSSDYRNGPFILNVSRQLTLPQTLLLAAGRVDKIELAGTTPEARLRWETVQKLAGSLQLAAIGVD